MQTHTRTEVRAFLNNRRKTHKLQNRKAKKKRITILPNYLNECDHARVFVCACMRVVRIVRHTKCLAQQMRNAKNTYNIIAHWTRQMCKNGQPIRTSETKNPT